MSKSVGKILKDQAKKTVKQVVESLEYEAREGAKAVGKAVTGQKLTTEEENLGKRRWEEHMMADLKDKKMPAKELEEKTNKDRWMAQEKQKRILEAIMPKRPKQEEEPIHDQINKERELQKRQMEEDAKKLEEQKLPLTTKRPRGDWRRGAHIRRKQSPELGKIPGQ